MQYRVIQSMLLVCLLAGATLVTEVFAEAEVVAVTFEISVPESVAANTEIYITGDFDQWSGGERRDPAYLATYGEDGKFRVTLRQPAGSKIQYKFTQGSWDSVEKDADGNDTGNRTFVFPKSNQVEQVSIAYLSTIDSLEDLEKEIERILTRHQVPGAVAAMVNREGRLWHKAFGYADLDAQRAATVDTPFRIGSISKMFVALAALQLQEQGKLDLNTPIVELVPELECHNPWASTDPVRVVHLLEHTAGWDDSSLREYASNDPTPLTLTAGLAFDPGARTSRWVPGTRFSYTNVGSGVAAYIIEKITGQVFEDYVREHLFAPLAMNNSTYFHDTLYQEEGSLTYSGGKPATYWHILYRPAGAINASVSDMENLLHMYLNKGRFEDTQIVSEASLQRMEIVGTTLAARAGLVEGYGLANYVTVDKGLVFHGHDGSVGSAFAQLAYSNEHGVGYFVASNSDAAEAFGQISSAVRRFLTRDIPANLGEPPQGLEKHRFADLGGYYQLISPRSEWSRVATDFLATFKLSVNGADLKFDSVFSPQSMDLIVTAEGVANLALDKRPAMVVVDDPLAGTTLQIPGVTGGVFRPISAVTHYGRVVLIAGWAVFALTSLVFAFVWLPRKCLGKINNPASVSVRVWPLLATLMMLVPVATVAVTGSSFDGSVRMLGAVTWASLLIFVATTLFPIFAVFSVWSLKQHARAGVGSFVYWHSALTAAFHVVLALYLASYGMIALMTWA